jgi:hypothetical protein
MTRAKTKYTRAALINQRVRGGIDLYPFCELPLRMLRTGLTISSGSSSAVATW